MQSLMPREVIATLNTEIKRRKNKTISTMLNVYNCSSKSATNASKMEIHRGWLYPRIEEAKRERGGGWMISKVESVKGVVGGGERKRREVATVDDRSCLRF